MRRRGTLVLGAGARELLLFAAAYLIYFGVRALTEGAVPEAVRNAVRIQSLERAVSVDVERAVQDLILRRETLVDAANAVYMYGHWPVLIVGGVLLFRYPRRVLPAAPRLPAVGGVGLAMFALFPVAPPRLRDSASWTRSRRRPAATGSSCRPRS